MDYFCFMERPHNFNAGPSVLPMEVLTELQEALVNFSGTGLSILEIGHRTRPFMQVMEEARELVRELMELDDDHEVLFLHGGASTQFMQVPMNFLSKRTDLAVYVDTGVWSTKAMNEASYFGIVEVIGTSKKANYTFIPKNFAFRPEAKYLHITTNNTIYGTQWKEIPEVSVPIVADMSSDILSRKLDFNRFGLIYAGLQKNLGCAGGSLVVVDTRWLDKTAKKMSPIMDYRQHLRAHSMYNTPPVFAVYVSLLMLRWIKKNGGLTAMEAQNAHKAQLLYDEIDRNSLFRGTVVKEDRSDMNVCFVMKDESLSQRFLEFAENNNIYGIAGHRSVGGFRASLYNALPEKSVLHLIYVMQAFEKEVLSGYQP